jgi:peptidoglycan-associated lipoprotein
MKLISRRYAMKNVIAGVLLISLMAACASEKPKLQANSPESQQPTPTASTPKSAASLAVSPLDDPNSILAKRSTYYPFDVSVVQAADLPLVQAHAAYLKDHPEQKVRLEGNCDERGSAEYNLALGQRRADGVKKLLIAGGAKADQITSISYGKEKPKLTCHAEKCWKENRRTDLVYQR